MIKLVAFDLNGVVTKTGHIIRNILSKIVDKEYKFVKQRYILFSRDEITQKEFWSSLGVDSFEDVENKFLSKIAPSVDKNFFLRLGRNYKLAIFSNFPKVWFDKILSNFGFGGIFDFDIVSGEVKVRKPDPLVYILLKRKSKLDFDEMIFIDDKKKNLKVAKMLGMKTIWMKNGSDNAQFEPDFVIDSLDELNDVL